MQHDPDVESRLAVYGTLAPGRPNHHHLSSLRGRWFPGRVRGTLYAEGWGAALGFPGIVLDDEAGDVEVQVLESAELPQHWERLDAFEGEGYVRVPVVVRVAGAETVAYIYALA